MAIEDYFTEEFYVQTPTAVKNDFQGHAVTWNRTVTFMGSKRPLSDSKTKVADQMRVFATHKIYCGVIEITGSDRIVDSKGGIHEVKEIIDPMSFGEHFEILVLNTGKNVGDE